MNKLISVCIPTYEMRGEAVRVLTRSFEMLKKQTYKNFEVVVSDNSEDNKIKNLCESKEYASLSINYSKNLVKGIASNTNNAMKNARGEIIKILYMDDYLAHPDALKNIIKNFKGYWLVTGCEHDDGTRRLNSHYPSYNKKIYLGQNTIGAPSVLSVSRKGMLFFDDKMTWLLDCDLYQRMYAKYGEPVMLNEVNVIIGVGKHQMTHLLPKFTKIKETIYLLLKYWKNKFLMLKYKNDTSIKTNN